MHESEEDTIARAIWTANRLIKHRARSSKRKFYSIKDEFIRRNLSHGTGQYEGLPWMTFDDSDFDVDDEYLPDTCHRCGGTGIYIRRWLYVHEFEVAGQKYSFHSYKEPENLLLELGEDKQSYGESYTAEEIAELPLPVSGLLKMLGYVAAARWRMVFDGVRYQQAAKERQLPQFT